MTIQEKDGQILQLRAELAAQRDENATQRDKIQRLMEELQEQAQEVQEARDLKAKMAAFVGSSVTATASTPQSTNVKAERFKRERSDDNSTSTRPAKRPQPEYVDLD
ncbi:hypothetical protein MMC30_007743 [Trapelia coarctata]|nr:hypothetical protein [Trapelia coarctata]